MHLIFSDSTVLFFAATFLKKEALMIIILFMNVDSRGFKKDVQNIANEKYFINHNPPSVTIWQRLPKFSIFI